MYNSKFDLDMLPKISFMYVPFYFLTIFFNFSKFEAISANSGKATSAVGSPKASIVFGPFAKTEFFINAGEGFHSNDARAEWLSTRDVLGK